jgi:hypothetical protein
VAERAKPERFQSEAWWPLEVAIAWVATGHPPLCQKVADFVEERRRHPKKPYPTLQMWMTGYQGSATTYDTTPGVIYRKELRKGWKLWRFGPTETHPMTLAISETARILRGLVRNVSRTNISTRRFAKGRRGEGEVDWIPARSWAIATMVDDRKLGLVLLQEDEAHGATVWRHITVQAEPFKALGVDRGRQSVSQREPNPRTLIEKNDRIRKKLELQSAKMGLAPEKPRGRPKGSKNVH